MNIKNIVINQFFGLGDILFVIPICKHLHDNGYKITFPVYPHFLGIARNFPYINFVDKNVFPMDYNNPTLQTVGDTMIIPMRFAWDILSHGIDPTKVMSDKYKMMDLPLDMWKTLEWKRTPEYENALYYDVLKLTDDSKYNLLNTSFTMNQNINITTTNGLQDVKMQIYNEFNMLDWAKVLEKATTIHTVGTSIFFMMEVLKLNECHLYRRPHEPDFSWYLPLSSKEYILHF